MLHVYGCRVARDVHLRDDVEEECLLDLGPVYQGVHHLRDEVYLRKEFVNYLRQRYIDSMVIDGRQLERQLNRLPELLQETAHVGLDSVEALNLLVVVHKHVRVDLVDEDLVPDVVLDAVRCSDHIKQLLASALIVSVVGIDDIDESTALLNVLLAVAFQHVVAREVIH